MSSPRASSWRALFGAVRCPKGKWRDCAATPVDRDSWPPVTTLASTSPVLKFIRARFIAPPSIGKRAPVIKPMVCFELGGDDLPIVADNLATPEARLQHALEEPEFEQSDDAGTMKCD